MLRKILKEEKMSLDYESLFSEIDKAKKKRWTQADTDNWAEQQKEEREKKPRVSQPKYTDGKESKSRGRTFGSLGEYSSGGVAGQKKQRHHSTSKKPTSVRIGDLDESGKKTGKEPEYSEREERSGMMGKPHKERKRRDTEQTIERLQQDMEVRRKKLQERREEEKKESERKENEKKQDKEWDTNKLLAARADANPRTAHPKKRRGTNYGAYSGEEKLGEEPSGMFGSRQHPRKKPKEETDARYKKIRAKIEEMEKEPYKKPVSAAGGKKVGIDAKERTDDDKEIRVDPRINIPAGEEGAMTEEEKERERKKFPQSGLAYTETTQLREPSSSSAVLDRERMAEQKERNRNIQRLQGITGHGTKKDPFVAPDPKAGEQLGSRIINSPNVGDFSSTSNRLW